jgi:hypothetical protein
VDVTVEIALNEEGYDRLRRYVCDDDLAAVQEDFLQMGLGVHRHGGIHYIEVRDCPGLLDPRKCPTPEDEEERERWAT